MYSWIHFPSKVFFEKSSPNDPKTVAQIKHAKFYFLEANYTKEKAAREEVIEDADHP